MKAVTPTTKSKPSKLRKLFKRWTLTLALPPFFKSEIVFERRSDPQEKDRH